MGMHEKQEAQEGAIRALLGIREGEPFFVMRAQDQISAEAYTHYVELAESEGCDMKFTHDLRNGLRDWKDWQVANADVVKKPD